MSSSSLRTKNMEKVAYLFQLRLKSRALFDCGEHVAFRIKLSTRLTESFIECIKVLFLQELLRQLSLRCALDRSHLRNEATSLESIHHVALRRTCLGFRVNAVVKLGVDVHILNRLLSVG